MPRSSVGDLVPPEDEPTDDLGVLHVLSHNAHLVLDQFTVCPKCCKGHKQLEAERSLATNAVRYVSDSLEFSSKRLMLIPELDSFAAWMCSRYSGPERRVIREALRRYQSDLREQVSTDSRKKYAQEGIELGVVSGCLLDLWNDGAE